MPCFSNCFRANAAISASSTGRICGSTSTTVTSVVRAGANPTNAGTVSYLVTDTYNPTGEHGINPLDPDIALVFPEEAGEALLSPKDTDAPSLREAQAAGLLPTWDAMRSFYDSLKTAGN